MRYFKIVVDGHVAMCGTGNGGTEITEAEYNGIFNAIQNKPAAPDGYGYRLREDLTWELYELPVAEETEEELTSEEAYNIIMGVDV